MTGEATAAVAVREVASAQVQAAHPKLSILTITYQHERFIDECVESAMGQETDFPFEMVIGEDSSRDRTRERCLALQRKYAERIRLLLPERNVGNYANFRNVFAACRGSYVAMLEGDDAWTDRRKLQKQVDLLDRHPEWAMTFHNVRIVNEMGGEERLFCTPPAKQVYTLKDFVQRNFIPTCSCLFRNRGESSLPGWYYEKAKNPYPDWILHALNAQHGDVGYIDEVMGIHRRHAGGVWGSTFNGTVEGDILRMTDRLTAFERLQECLPCEYRRDVRRQRAWACFHLALAYREKADWPQVRRFMWASLRLDPASEIPAVRGLLLACLPAFRRTIAGARRN